MSGDIYISGKSSNNKITISGSGEKKDIDLSTKEANNNLATQNNNAKYYSDKALESANKAEQSANLAKGYAESVVETKNELLNNQDFKTVVNNIDNINTVGENIENVITIAEDLDVVADSLDVINNVNDNLDVITSVNTNIQDIQNAEENANVAKEKAQESANYLELSRQWAISETLVDNTDYSSKHYATVATEQANKAELYRGQASQHAEEAQRNANIASSSSSTAYNHLENAREQATIAITKASEASQSASNALKSSQNSALSEANAKESENKAKTSETNALNSANVATQQAQIAKDEVAKLSTVYKYKGSVATINNLPTNANVGDVYDTQETGMNYAWNGTEWDELGGTFDVSWGSLKGSISDNTDLQSALDSKANVSDIPDVSNFITKDNLVELPSELITEAELSSFAYDKATVDGKIAEAVTGGTVDLSGYAKDNEVVHLANAETITGAKTFTGAVNLIGSGDSNAVGISTNTRFNVHNTTKTVLGFGSGLFYINHGDYRLRLRGKDTRPHYNSDTNYLALLSDIPDVSNFASKEEIPDVSNFIKKENLVELPSELITEAELEEALKGVGGGREVGELVTGFWSANHVPKNLLYCDGTEFSGAEGEMFHELYSKKLLGEITQDAIVESTGKATNGIYQGSSSFGFFVRIPLTASSVPYGDLPLNFTTGSDVTTEQFIYKFISGSTETTLSIMNGSFVTRDNTPAVAIATAKPNTNYTLKITSGLQVSIIENGVETVIGTASSFSTNYCWFFGNAGSGSISGFLGTINLLSSTYTNANSVSVPLAKMQSELDTCSYSEYQTELTMTGSCWKWAVDTANEKFRIPFIPDKVVVDIDDTIGVRGNDLTLGITDGTDNYGIAGASGSSSVTVSKDYGATVGAKVTQAGSIGINALGITSDASKSGIIADTTTAKTYKTIRHFVVVATGSIEQTNADWTNFANGLASKANNDLSNVTQSSGLRRLIEVSDSSLMPSWYKVFEETNPATGEVKKWCEQGGLSTTKTATSVIDLIKSYKYKNSYSVDITWTHTASADNYGAIVNITSNNSFTIYRSGTGAQKLSNFWTAKGYIQ